jgi:formyltetrahydrofolate deformylase
MSDPYNPRQGLPSMPRHNEFILTLSCPDAKGIVYTVSGLLYQAGCNIIDSQQYGDLDGADATGLFFMRVHFQAPEHLSTVATLQTLFAHARGQHRMDLAFHAVGDRPRLLLMVSQHGHCLNDLLFRWRSGQLPVDIPAIVSNHPDFAELAAGYGIPFHHLPLKKTGDAAADAQAKRAQEQQVMALVERERVDLVVLARYMQILSAEFCEQLKGRAINIHHSFLPSFKGAKPYYQAHARGVKLIGATAHYVTAELDEGPIIEQDVERVDHTLSAEDFTAVGRDIECVVLARAVRWHVEHRVLMNGHKCVVFR